MVLRLIGSLMLLVAGFLTGFTAAAAMLRGWLPSRGDETSDELALVGVLDGIDLTSRATAFAGGSVLAWYGGVALDLREATLAPGAMLEVRAALGGISIKVPPGCRVESEARAVAGGVDVSVPDPDDPDAPTLRVRASAFLGGVSISG